MTSYYFLFTDRPLTKEELTTRHEAVKQRIAERATHNENSTGDDIDQVTTNAADTSEEATPTEEATKDGETFIAFARIFSGTLKKGSSLYVLGPKYDPSNELEDEVSLKANGEKYVVTCYLVYILATRISQILFPSCL